MMQPPQPLGSPLGDGSADDKGDAEGGREGGEGLAAAHLPEPGSDRAPSRESSESSEVYKPGPGDRSPQHQSPVPQWAGRTTLSYCKIAITGTMVTYCCFLVISKLITVSSHGKSIVLVENRASHRKS